MDEKSVLSSDEYGYLPVLENVATSARPMIGVFLLFGGLAACFGVAAVWALLKYREFFTPSQTAAVLLIPALVLWVVCRVLFSYLQYSTDSSGLTMRGPLRRRTIPWIGVERAWTTKSRLDTTVLNLQTRAGRFKIAQDAVTDFGLLLASVWQHLRPLGRVDGIELSDRIKSLWREVPDSVPQEMRWGKAPSPSRKVGAWLGVLLYPAAVLALLAMGTNDRALTVILIVMLPGVWALTRLFWSEQMFSAHEVWVDREGITGQTVRGETRILWSEVARAAWKPVGGVMGLEIKADNPRRQLRIRLATGLKESEQLFLAIIRRLRAQGYSQPLVLPVMVSDDPSVLDRPTASSGRQTGVQRAYLNTLPEPARRRLSGLWYLQVGLVITGLFIGAVIPIILDPVARLSWKLHAVGAPGVRFFVTISSLPLAVPAIILCSAVFAMLGSLIGYRWSGPHRKEWRRVQTIGSTRKTNIVAAILVGVVGVGTAVLVVVLVNSYIRVSDDGIAVRRLGALQEQRYGWSDVRRVNINSRYVYSKNGGHDKITYTITFSDGSDWSAKDPSILSVKEPELQKMLSYVAEKGHMKVEREYSGD